jgi:hypothetical protein
MLAARRQPPQLKEAADLLADGSGHRVEVRQLIVPDVQGHCEIIDGGSPAEKATALVRRLGELGVLRG